LYFYGARYYDHELGRFITADTFIQATTDPQALNRYSYCRNNPINYIDPTGHFWWVAAIIGAILGGVSAALNEQPIWQGILMGAAGGALIGVGASTFGFWGAVAAGAFSGTANSAVFGGNLGIGALSGAIGAGLGYGLGTLAGSENFLAGLAAAAGSGAISGGVGAELQGGSFGEGAWMGAAYGSAGYIGSQAFNYGINKADAKKAESLELQREQALNVDGGKVETKASTENQKALEVYKRGILLDENGMPSGEEVHPYMKIGDKFYESDTYTNPKTNVATINIRSGLLSEMSLTTQKHFSTNPQPFRKVAVYYEKFNSAVQSYRVDNQGNRYYMGSYLRDCRDFPYDTIKESRVR
jgi:hypothetical protein